MLYPFTTNAWLRFDAIRHDLKLAHPRSLLEVGAGEGAFATWVSPRLEYRGVEQDDRSRALAQRRLDGARRGRLASDLGEISETFDMVCAFEVLEHIENDVAALVDWRARLNPGGHILLSVPAHARRYGPHDELAGHFRRYDRAALTTTLERAGFVTRRLTSHGIGLGQVLEWARNQIARRQASGGTFEDRTAASGRLIQPHSGASALACAALAAPFRLVQAPFAGGDVGTGYVALARIST
jgi:SAM-dependent methyltransferase